MSFRESNTPSGSPEEMESGPSRYRPRRSHRVVTVHDEVERDPTLTTRPARWFGSDDRSRTSTQSLGSKAWLANENSSVIQSPARTRSRESVRFKPRRARLNRLHT